MIQPVFVLFWPALPEKSVNLSLMRRQSSVLVESVLYSVFDLGSLAVVESVKCSYQVSCDPPDPLESYAFSYLSVNVLYNLIIHLGTSISLTIIILAASFPVKPDLYILLYLFQTRYTI